RLTGGQSARIHFAGPRPRGVTVSGLDFPVEEEKAVALQCYGCGRFGHIRAACGLPTGCPTCTGRHARGACPLQHTPTCPNCLYQHSAFNPDCPVHRKKTAIAARAQRTGCTWAAAGVIADRQAEPQQQNQTEKPERNQESHGSAQTKNAWTLRPQSSAGDVDFPALPSGPLVNPVAPPAGKPRRPTHADACTQTDNQGRGATAQVEDTTANSHAEVPGTRTASTSTDELESCTNTTAGKRNMQEAGQPPATTVYGPKHGHANGERAHQ
ncbi:hypothetical protein HPB47_019098, partial [Ixodes persulcatus]